VVLRAGLRRPHNRPVLKKRIAVVSRVSDANLVAGWVAEVAPFPAKLCPALADSPVRLMRVGLRRPVDRTALKMVIPTNSIRSRQFVGERVAETLLPTGLCPFVANPPVDEFGTASGRPVERSVLVVTIAADPVRRCQLVD